MSFTPLILAAGALGALMQGAGETYVALPNDVPETWSVEYPSLIRPFVDDYRRCLNIENRQFRGIPEFEELHRADVPRCDKASSEAQEAANAVLADRDESGEFTPAEVKDIFEHIGRIHIARGADLDGQFRSRIARSEAAMNDYDRTRPKGLVIELRGAEELTALSHSRFATSNDAPEGDAENFDKSNANDDGAANKAAENESARNAIN